MFFNATFWAFQPLLTGEGDGNDHAAKVPSWNQTGDVSLIHTLRWK